MKDLDQLLQETPIADDGFTGRVMDALPSAKLRLASGIWVWGAAAAVISVVIFLAPYATQPLFHWMLPSVGICVTLATFLVAVLDVGL